MRRKNLTGSLKIVKEKTLFDAVIYQETSTNKGVFIERYSLLNEKASLEILIFVGLNISPSTKYFGHFPFNLCKETGANVSIVYEIGCSGKLNRYFRRFTQLEAEAQYLAGFEIVKNFRGKVIIFSHSASTIEHLKLIFSNKYKNFSGGINIVGGIVSGCVTNVLLELKGAWPNYKIFNWKNIMKTGRFFNLPLPIYPYFSKALHAKYSSMNNLSIWINSGISEFLLGTNVKKIILNGEKPDYSLLVFISKHDAIFSPTRQATLAKYMAKKAKVTVVKCDAEHNLFLSSEMAHILKEVKEYIRKI